MCDHRRTVIDRQVAEEICIDCGLVLNKVYTNDKLISPPATDSGSLAAKDVDRIRGILDVMHLDNQHVRERVLNNYGKIYGRRKKVCRGTARKENIAIAFAICNTLTRLRIPRPPEHVLHLCGLSSSTKFSKNKNSAFIFNISKELKLSEAEMMRLKKEDYELAYAPPQYYIDTACSYLEIPFQQMQEMYEVALKANWTLYGKQPTVIAAASILHVLKRNGHWSREMEQKVKDQLSCDVTSIRHVMSLLI